MTGRTRRQPKKSVITRKALVQAAVDVISEVGYAATTTTLIAERAGVSRGALQHHFKSKTDVIIAVLNEIDEAVNLRLDVETLSKMSIPERVEALLNHYYEIYGGKLHVAAIQIRMSAWGDPRLQEEVRNGLNLMEDAVLEAWRRTFPEVEIDNGRLMSIRHVILSTIRGSTMREIWYNQKRDWGNDFVVLRDFLIFYVESHAGKQTRADPKS